MLGHRRVGVLTIAGWMTLVGCGGNGGSETGGSSQGGSTGGGGGTTSAGGGGTTAGGGGGSGGSIDASLFAGVDPGEAQMGTAPAGCEGQFDAKTGLLALTLGQGVTGVLVGVVNGKIQANGVVCTTADKTPATPESVQAIQITGSAADEVVIVDLATGPFGDRIFGAGGGIHVDLAGGADLFALRGSLGDDTALAGADGDKLVLDLTSRGAADVDVTGAESFALSFGPGKDAFHGTGIAGGAAAKVALSIFGDDGDDTLQGGAGNDALHGGAGDDLFATAAALDGADLYDGGAGMDRLDYGARAGALVVTMGANADDGEVGENDDVGDSIEALVGGAGDDTLVGSAADNEIHGGAGKDTIHGGDGADAINGEAGDDHLFGDAGDDNLFGDDGADTLDGGEGSDVLDGGGGADKFDGGGGDGDVCLIEGPEDPASCELY